MAEPTIDHGVTAITLGPPPFKGPPVTTGRGTAEPGMPKPASHPDRSRVRRTPKRQILAPHGRDHPAAVNRYFRDDHHIAARPAPAGSPATGDGRPSARGGAPTE